MALIDKQIRDQSIKNLEERTDRVKQAIRSTLANAHIAKHNGDAFFCVGWGIHLWYVCDETDVIDGPFDKEKAHQQRDLMNRILGEKGHLNLEDYHNA